MGDDWQVGDLAMRVRQGTPCPDCGIEPIMQPGAVATVSAVRHLYAGLTLFMEGHPEQERRGGCVHVGEDPANYRKIRPHTPDAEDAETIALLTGKPAQVPA